MNKISLNNIKGFKIGSAQDKKAGTGCTVILNPSGAVAGVDVRGGSPGTRETDLLDPVNLVEKIHAVVLSGGSAFGLEAASGVMEYLEEKNIGFDVGVTKVPIVSGAVLFDLSVGNYRIRPDKKMGYEACKNIYEDEIPNGNIGAGTGATVGKYMGMDQAMKGGMGTFAYQIDDLKIGALVAVNCFGDVLNPRNSKILAGALKNNSEKFVSGEKNYISNLEKAEDVFSGNTTIGIVLTNAKIDKSQANKLASIAHDGYATTMHPSHSIVDGDTIFTMATGNIDINLNTLGTLSTKVMEKAVVNAIKNANSLLGYKSYSDIYES